MLSRGGGGESRGRVGARAPGEAGVEGGVEPGVEAGVEAGVLLLLLLVMLKQVCNSGVTGPVKAEHTDCEES